MAADVAVLIEVLLCHRTVVSARPSHSLGFRQLAVCPFDFVGMLLVSDHFALERVVTAGQREGFMFYI
jgi:hypothetical protein